MEMLEKISQELREIAFMEKAMSESEIFYSVFLFVGICIISKSAGIAQYDTILTTKWKKIGGFIVGACVLRIHPNGNWLSFAG